MEKYILTWHVDDYLEEGGGDHFQFFSSLEKVQEKVDELTKHSDTSIKYCAQIKKEFGITPVEVVVKQEIKEL